MVARSGKTDAKVYNSQDDRDAALDGSYNLSNRMREVIGNERASMLGLVYDHVAQIAAEFLSEDRSHEHVESFFERWQQRHFGRVLEYTARCLLHQEIWRHLDKREGGTDRPSGAVYASPSEQKRWQDAEAKVRPYVPGESHLARLEAICRSAGAVLGPGVGRMPAAESPRMHPDREFERLQVLRSQAARIVGEDDDDPAPARLPYRDPE